MHFVTTHLSHLLYAAVGGILTSTAEKAFNYNLVDLLYEKVAGLFGKKS